MNKSWFYFRKSDRRVLMLLLAIGLLAATVLVVFFSKEGDAPPKIEQPEHWWE